MLDLLRGLDECSDAVQRALATCARSGAIPATGEDAGVHDPAWCLAVEATYLVKAARRLRGRTPRKEYYA